MQHPRARLGIGSLRWSSLLALLCAPGCGDDATGTVEASGSESSSSDGAVDTSSGALDSTTGASTSGDPTQGPTGSTTGDETTSDTSTSDASTGDETTSDASTSDASTSDASTGTTGPEPACGDGAIDTGEACDGPELGGEDCLSQGFAGGVLACLPDCSALDATGCVAAGMGDCCAPHRGTGCSDAACQASICGYDPFCCDVAWDGICADEGLADPACLDAGGACPCPDENIGSTTGPAVTAGNTGGDDDDVAASCGGASGNDRLVLFTAPADASYTFDTFGSSYDTKLSLHTSDCAAELACNDDADGGLTSQLQLDMVAGQRVRIVIDGYDGATGDWVLSITEAPLMPPVCGDGVVEAPEICDGANLNGQTCLFQGFPGGGALACAPDCLTFDTSGCVDGPYACSDADIGGATGAAVAAGNTAADDDDLAGSCGGASGNDHVVTFTAPVAGDYTFDTFGSAYDTKLGLWSDCTSELYCNDDTDGLQSQLAIGMGAGQEVLVVIDGYDGATGAWVLNITPP